MSSSVGIPGPDQSPVISAQSTPTKKGKVVGLYGIPGSGKTFLLDQLKQILGEDQFLFYDGSEKIASLVDGGLEAFQNSKGKDRTRIRRRAIDEIGKDSTASKKVAVVAGHYMFWLEGGKMEKALTSTDFETYTHILYLDVAPQLVKQQCQADKEKTRPSASLGHLRNWQEYEKIHLRQTCQNHNILFSLVSKRPTILDMTLMLLRDFQRHNESHNRSRAKSELDKAVTSKTKCKTILVIDADKTLAPQDTSKLFWQKASSSRGSSDKDDPLKALFSSWLRYSHNAFRQATLLYEEAANNEEFETLCEDVALTVEMHTEFVSLLQVVGEAKDVGAVVVTCGLRRVWEIVLERAGLIGCVSIVGGGRIADDLVVTADIKATLVTRLQEVYQMRIWAFGDGPLDLEMLQKADRAVIVVGEEEERSKSMDALLKDAIENEDLKAYQALLPSVVPPRLDVARLPLIDLTGHDFVDNIFERHKGRIEICVLHATDKSAAQLLMTPMRNADIARPALRKAHRRVGWYLATKFLTEMIGVEEYRIPHVLQSHRISGYRLLHEQRTLIVVLMRGGEPMASGVNEAFPKAMFLHAKHPEDLMPYHLQERQTVVLVDSVVNTGKSVVEFVQHVRKLNATIRIMVVAGVVQAQFASSGSLDNYTNLKIVALRFSETKFKGSGTTDTGNRLFNTTHML